MYVKRIFTLICCFNKFVKRSERVTLFSLEKLQKSLYKISISIFFESLFIIGFEKSLNCSMATNPLKPL